MKFITLIIFNLFFLLQLSAQDTISNKTKSQSLSSDSIIVNPQPFKIGDLIIYLTTKEIIINTSLYKITGDLIFEQSHQSNVAYNFISISLEEGEYILKVETDKSVGIKKITIK